MSIINQMLRDLDARQASSQERAGLPSSLRTLPPEPRRRAQPWGLLAIGLIVGAAAVGFFASQSAPPPAVPAEKTAAPQPAPVPAIPAAPPVETPVVAEPASSPPAVSAVVTAPPAAPAPTANAKPATVEKPIPPVPAPAAKPSAPPSPASTGEQARPAASATEQVEAKPAAPAAVGEARIDKQPKTAPTRELAEAEFRKGMQAASQGDHAAALPALRRALELEPLHAKARQALLAVLANGRQWEEVKQVAQAGLALDPTRSGWATLLARLQYEEGDVETALKTLETHAAHAASDADFHALFAFILQQRQRHAEAVLHYQAALRLRPNEGRWWYGLGLALEAAGRGDEARATFVKARETGNLPSEMKVSVEEKLRSP